MQKAAFSLFIVLLSAQLFAQDNDPSFQKSRIAIGFYTEPDHNFSDSNGKYSYKQVFIRSKVPVYSKTFKTDQLLKFKYLRFNWDAGAAFGFPDISFISNQQQLYYFMTGISGFYFNGSKSLWSGSLHTSISEDNFSISDPSLRFSGHFSYMHTSSEVFDYHLGVAYTYLFGNAYVLPFLGFRYHFNEKWKYALTLPFRTSLTFRPNKSNDLEFFIAPAGSQSGFSSNGLIDTSQDFIVKMRKQQYQTGIDWKFNKKSNISFDIKAGLLLGRKLSFIDDGDVISETSIKNSGFIFAGISFKFGKHSKDKNKNPGISDELLDNFDPAELE